jgi:hypothetical protein
MASRTCLFGYLIQIFPAREPFCQILFRWFSSNFPEPDRIKWIPDLSTSWYALRVLVWDGGGHIWIRSSMFDILLVSWNGQICRQALSQRVHPFLRLPRGGNGETNIESESGEEPCRLFSHVPQISYMHGHSSLEISVEILRECIFCLLPKMSTSWMCLTNCFPLSTEFSPVI